MADHHSIVGNPGTTPILKSSKVSFDPNSGWMKTQVYRGTVAAINALQAAYNSVGWKTENSTNGSQWLELTVSIPESQGQGEVPIDKYELNMDFVQEDVFKNPKFLDTLLNDGRFDFGTLQEVSRQRTEVEKAIASGQNIRDSGTPPAFFSGHLLQIMTIGPKYTERERPVLVRNRTFSLNYSFPVELDATPTVYSTSALISTYGIPNGVARQLPSNPSYTIEDTTWGWKKRRDNSEIIPAMNKVQETKDWVFDAWSNFCYNFIT